ncbi:activity-dependent neuroprotector homeobox a isoform X3 [Cyprinodon tularosa]|uniref:activity-dependent neuroprotector homeobox a isoform X2 n=1 Tax=Cyprinodon tularosa TaxID=77115 RepID=UPI0018E28701|nr:activity-dependent neuroprotector homeobox a isoform X2 [Cyprinodon tularosa]XP_038151774.1 activity-dependent neuroprotector homeobox a isoform X3 [Cyprinodon tularosa]
MYQLPVNNLTRIRKARKQVKKNLEDIGLELCKEVAEEFKEFCPDEQTVKDSLSYDICTWDPTNSKSQGYRSKQFCCTECRFSSKYYSGYKNHFRSVHRKILDSQLLLNCPYCSFSANRRTLETHVKIFHISNPFQPSHGNPRASVLGNSTVQGNRLEKPMYFCKKCKYRDALYNVVRRHIYREHFQHVVLPYYGKVSPSLKNGACSVNGNSIFCKQCSYSTRSYEGLVQHVVEFHERIGSQVTNMIGHANVMSKPQPTMNEKAALIINRAKAPRPEPSVQPVIGYLKPTFKSQRSIPANPKRVTVGTNGSVAENNQTGVNTAQTQKWKICTVCNELFPENLYSAHFECAHKAKKVWALAKYIMKIHNFTSKCLLCNRYLPSSTLLNHMLIHGLTCPQCHSAFHSVEKIMEHTAKTHPDEFFGPTGAAPLTFDLTIKQSKPTNIQLAVLPFNMKDSPNGQDQSAPALQSVHLPGKVPPVRIMEKQGEPRSFPSLFQTSEVGKTVCPLCFSILKGPVSEALAMHLRQRHQVIQTIHPVENKMTYKCIHCLGVYTSNMVASTITLHLVQCRAVGRNQSNQGFKSSLTLNSAGAGILKRQLPTQSPSNPKRIKMSKRTGPFRGSATTFDSLVLDPSGWEHKTHEARKEFLTAYFNRRPYPTSQEVEKLAASLWLWKSEVASHFTMKQMLCVTSCETKRVSVQVGLDMDAVSKLKHYLIFDKGRLVGTSAVRSLGLKSYAPYPKPKWSPQPPNPIVDHSGLHIEIISIDSDNEEEMENPVQIDDTNKEENKTVTANHGDHVEFQCREKLTEGDERVGMADPIGEESKSPNGKEADLIQEETILSDDEAEPNQEQRVTLEDENFEPNQEEVILSEDANVEHNQEEKVTLEDANNEPNQEEVILSEDANVEHNQEEKVTLEDANNEPNQEEKVILEDENVEPNQEKVLSEDANVEANQEEKVILEDENVEQNQEEVLSEDANVEPNQEEKVTVEDENVEPNQEEKVLSEDANTEQNQEVLSEDENVEANQEEVILEDEKADVQEEYMESHSPQSETEGKTT